MGIAPGVMLNSVRPRPINSPTSAGSDAISPHSDTGMRWRRGGAAHQPDQPQHRRMQRLVVIGHPIVGAIDGQRVLDQIVGADGEEVDIGGEQVRGQRRRRDLDHRTDLDAARMSLG